MRKMFYLGLFVSSLIALTGCLPAAPSPTPTPIEIVKPLATVFISPTPDAAALEATRVASTPTPIPPTPTIIPTETPYIGTFLGEATLGAGFQNFREPLFVRDESAAPTADATRCSIVIDPAFITVWRTTDLVNQRLGCPIQQGFGFFGESQIFENGVMYHYPDLNAIWALVDERFEYLENPPENSTIGIQTDAGLTVPGGIFGDMWLAVPDLQDRIGFALVEQGQTSFTLQRFENGTFLYDRSSEQLFALIIDGSVVGPYLAPPDAIENAENAESDDAATATPAP